MNNDLYKDEAMKAFQSCFEDEESYARWLWTHKQRLEYTLENFHGHTLVQIGTWKQDIGKIGIGKVRIDSGFHSHDDAPAQFIWLAPNMWTATWWKDGVWHRPRRGRYSQPAKEIHHFDGTVTLEYWQRGERTKPDKIRLKADHATSKSIT